MVRASPLCRPAAGGGPPRRGGRQPPPPRDRSRAPAPSGRSPAPPAPPRARALPPAPPPAARRAAGCGGSAAPPPSALARDRASPRDALALERLRSGGHVLGGSKHAPLLGQDDQLGASRRGCPHEAVGGGQIPLGVGSRVKLNGCGEQSPLSSRVD